MSGCFLMQRKQSWSYSVYHDENKLFIDEMIMIIICFILDQHTELLIRFLYW